MLMSLMKQLASANLIFNFCLILCASSQKTLPLMQQQQQQQQASHLQPPSNNIPGINIFHNNNQNNNNHNIHRQAAQSATTPTFHHHHHQYHHQNNQMIKPLERPNLTHESSSSSSSSLDNQMMMNNANSTEPTVAVAVASAAQQEQQTNVMIPESAADWLMLGTNTAEDLNPVEGKNVASFADVNGAQRNGNMTIKRLGNKRKSSNRTQQSGNNTRTSTTIFDDEQSSSDSSDNEVYDDVEGEGSTLAGTSKEPECASQGRYYCTYKEDYPLKLVTEVTKYYKWPLEKLFRDLHAQIMPKLAQDSSGNLVCDSITRVVRPGWARNTNDRWLVVINTENYHQYVTEVVCQYGPNSRCNFIPPCYYSSCQQRYNTQKLLVIDPTNPYRGPFLSEFLFPSCCVCYVPSTSESFQDKYRSSPATIYQRTMQQEAANNLYPPQFKPTGLLEDLPSSFIEQAASGSSISGSGNGRSQQQSSSLAGGSASASKVSASTTSAAALAAGRVLAPGEIRRSGETRT